MIADQVRAIADRVNPIDYRVGVIADRVHSILDHVDAIADQVTAINYRNDAIGDRVRGINSGVIASNCREGGSDAATGGGFCDANTCK